MTPAGATPAFRGTPRTLRGDPTVLLAVASGLLLALAFPAADGGWLAWVALLPLFAAIDDGPPRAAFGRGWIFGLAFHLAALYWITPTLTGNTAVPLPVALLPTLLLAAVLALYSGAFAAAVAAAARRGIAPAAFAPPCWVALEWLRAHLFSGFPWVGLGYSQYRQPALIQIAELTGVYGLSALLVLFNATVFAVLRQRGTVRARAAQLGALTFVLAAVHQFGVLRLDDLADRTAGRRLRAAVLQGNIPQDRKWDPDHQEETISIYETLTREAAGAGVDVAVWPETAAPFFFQLGGPLAERVRSLARETGLWLVVGAPGFARGAAGESRLFNRAYVVSPDGATAGHYDKVKLVPFGEYVPGRRLLFFLDKLVAGNGEFAPGAGPVVLPLAGRRAGVLICYEAIFPHLVRRFVDGGADVLLNLTNDAWYGRTSAPGQHLALAALRAVENRVPLLRAANTGFSAVVEPDGRISQRTDLFERGLLIADLHWPAVRTFYTRHGDVFAAACVAAALLLPAAAPLRRALSALLRPGSARANGQ